VATNRLQGILSFVGLLAVCGGLGYGAWIGLTRPPSKGKAPTRREAPKNDSLAFVAVAGEGVDLEVIAPSGRTTSTAGPTSGDRIPGSDATVDCPGFADSRTGESACTASINISAPAAGDYTVVARAGATQRTVTLNVGWATASQVKRGGFDVRVQIAPGGATAFTFTAARDAVSQRSEPRPWTR
jgi:hypothetical protein